MEAPEFLPSLSVIEEESRELRGGSPLKAQIKGALLLKKVGAVLRYFGRFKSCKIKGCPFPTLLFGIPLKLTFPFDSLILTPMCV